MICNGRVSDVLKQHRKKPRDVKTNLQKLSGRRQPKKMPEIRKKRVQGKNVFNIWNVSGPNMMGYL
jgi:hypothetical protein